MLRPAEGWLKRLVTSMAVAWDEVLPKKLQDVCHNLEICDAYEAGSSERCMHCDNPAG